MKLKMSVISVAAIAVLLIGTVGYSAATWLQGASHHMPRLYRDAQGTTITFYPYDQHRTALGDATLQETGEPPRQLAYQDDHRAQLVIISLKDGPAVPSGDAWWDGMQRFLQIHTNFQLGPNDESFVVNGDRFDRQGE